MRQLIRSAVTITGQYRDFEREARSAFPECAGRIVVIPNGVRVDRRRAKSASCSDSESLCIGYFGGSDILKGFPAIVSLIGVLAGRGQGGRGVRFVLGGEYDSSAKELIAQLDERFRDRVRIDFVGFISGAKFYRALATTDVLVMPSLKEGFSNLLLEAMSFGVVPVVTPVGGAKDILLDGVNGKLLPLHPDGAEIASAIDALNGKIDEMGQRARRTVVEGYRLEEALGRMVRLYRAAVGEMRSG